MKKERDNYYNYDHDYETSLEKVIIKGASKNQMHQYVIMNWQESA